MTPLLVVYGQAAATPPAAPAEEVNVRGKRQDIGQTTLAASDVREMPGAFGDPFRAVEALPGVTPIVSGAPYFYMRGAPPTSNGYFLDGIRVPLLFHVGLAQGVIHPGLVERVDFFPGAPPAQYGGFAGAVIAARTRDPRPELHGEANLRLVDAGALVEAPFANGRGTALVAARYGYPGLVLGALQDEIKLDYWDYQARATYRLGERDTIGLFAFGSHDLISTKDQGGGGEPAGREIERIASDFHRLDLRWDHALTEGKLRVAATLGRDDQGAQPTYVIDHSIAGRVEFEKRVHAAAFIRSGARVAVDDYGFEQRGAITGETPLVPSPATARTNVTAAGYADVIWKVAPRVELVPGLRSDVFNTVATVDPRLSARVTLTDHVAYIATAGLAHQLPALRVGQVPVEAVTMPGFLRGSRRTQEVAQASQGVEVGLPAEIKVTATAFLAGWTALTDITAFCLERMPAFQSRPVSPDGPPPPVYDCPSNELGHSRAYGLELLARRSLSKRLSGWVSYTLSRATREARFGDRVVTVPSEGDRTHVFNAIAAFDLGRRWRLGGRFVYFSGSPYSRQDGSILLPPYNAYRLDPFFRVDARLEKRWRLGKDGSIAFVFEVQNISLSKQQFTGSCEGDADIDPNGIYTETNRCGPSDIGPLTIPSVGVEAFF